MTIIITVVDDNKSSGPYYVAKTEKHSVKDIVNILDELWESRPSKDMVSDSLECILANKYIVTEIKSGIYELEDDSEHLYFTTKELVEFTLGQLALGNFDCKTWKGKYKLPHACHCENWKVHESRYCNECKP